MSQQIQTNMFVCGGERTGPAVRVNFDQLQPFTAYNCSGSLKVFTTYNCSGSLKVFTNYNC